MTILGSLIAWLQKLLCKIYFLTKLFPTCLTFLSLDPKDIRKQITCKSSNLYNTIFSWMTNLACLRCLVSQDSSMNIFSIIINYSFFKYQSVVNYSSFRFVVSFSILFFLLPTYPFSIFLFQGLLIVLVHYNFFVGLFFFSSMITGWFKILNVLHTI